MDPHAIRPGSRNCEECPTTKIHFEKARAAFHYGGVAAELIKALKFRYKTDILPFFVDALSKSLRQHYFEERIDVVVPVPLHWTRRWSREFNQSELLAAKLSETANIPCVKDSLKRVRRTKPQSTLQRIKRITNLKNAFAVIAPEAVKDKHVLLIDDVYTTGTTVNECSRVLKEAGAGSVCILTVARATKTTGNR